MLDCEELTQQILECNKLAIECSNATSKLTLISIASVVLSVLALLYGFYD